jgi:hypothetical protein
MFMAPHLQENHADYLAWKKSKFKPSIVAGIATGIIFDFLLALVLYNSGIQLPHGRAGAWPFLVVLFSALPVPWLLLNQWVSAGSGANGTNGAVSLHRICR